MFGFAVCTNSFIVMISDIRPNIIRDYTQPLSLLYVTSQSITYIYIKFVVK